MTKDDFFDVLDKSVEYFARRNWKPQGLRLNYSNDPFDINWKIWVVGPSSIDATLVMALDIYPVKGKFKSEDRANAAFAKYKRWFDEWEEFQEWKNENSFE